MKTTPVAANNGAVYIPYEKRTGEESTVFFTRDLSAEGLKRIFRRIGGSLSGKIAVKLHTGEPKGPNLIPRQWVKALIGQLSDAAIVETNSYYPGDRHTTEKHRETLTINGWDFCIVDILDENGGEDYPVKDGKWFDKIQLGKNLKNYDSMLVLTHFKGHTNGGFGGSNKNIGIGCAEAQNGKRAIHTIPGHDIWSISKEEFMERMTESSKAVVDHFGEKIVYINVMRNMSVSCDCEGIYAEPVVTPNVGICASTDILAVDQACVDMIYAMEASDRHAMVERIETRRGLRQLSYMKELGMGNDRYRLIDTDNDDIQITAADAVADVRPFVLD